MKIIRNISAMILLSSLLLMSCNKPDSESIFIKASKVLEDNEIVIDLSERVPEESGIVKITPSTDSDSDKHFLITIENTNPSFFEVNFIPFDSHPLKIKDGRKRKHIGILSIEQLKDDCPEQGIKIYKIKIPKQQSTDKMLYITTYSGEDMLHFEKAPGIPHKHNRYHRIGDPRFY